MIENIFLEFAIVLGAASILGYVAHRIRLPLVVAYLVTGVCLAALVQIQSAGNLGIFTYLPDIGIAFVLFLSGMELDLRELKALGKPIIISSLCQIVISALAGYSIASWFGFPQIQAFLLGVGLSFSSTVVIVKILLEKKDLASLYGKLSIGITLIEDLVAITILMLVSVGGALFLNLNQQFLPLTQLTAKAILFFILTYFLSKYALKKLFDSVARSTELLFLTAITWCFLFAALAQLINFSVTIGAFLAGIALASSPYHYQIQGKIKPLRDFFVTLFFVYLGTQVRLADLETFWPLVLVFTVYALLGKPLIFLLSLGAFGFKKHTIFQSALNLSQISEFSLVMLLLGERFGLVPPTLLSVMAAVAVLSIMVSSILITYSNIFYGFVSPLMSFFVRSGAGHYLEEKPTGNLEDHIVLIGAHRVGGPIVEYLQKSKIPFVVMDFNPHVVESLKKKGINIIYGDVGDPEMLETLQLEKAKLIISTATQEEDNEQLLSEAKRKHLRAKMVVRALDEPSARHLKQMGADYVIMPETVSGDFLVSQLKSHWPQVHFSMD